MTTTGLFFLKACSFILEAARNLYIAVRYCCSSEVHIVKVNAEKVRSEGARLTDLCELYGNGSTSALQLADKEFLCVQCQWLNMNQ